MQRRKSRRGSLPGTFLLLFLYVSITEGQGDVRHESLKQKDRNKNEHSSTAKPTAACKRHIKMTLCQDYCKTGCVSYVTPFNGCYNPQKMFPNDASWGNEDVLDANITFSTDDTVTFERSFYSTLDGTCGGMAESIDLPLNECVGPFGAPRPWGKFELLS